jgi:hypothetical protein
VPSAIGLGMVQPGAQTVAACAAAMAAMQAAKQNTIQVQAGPAAVTLANLPTNISAASALTAVISALNTTNALVNDLKAKNNALLAALRAGATPLIS